MVAPTDGAALGAALYFYNQYTCLQPGSEGAAIAERAVSIAVARASKNEASTALFDIWRNARFSHRRSQRRERQARTRLKLTSDAGVVTAANGGQRVPTPEQLLVAKDLEERLRAAAVQIHTHGARTLDGMLDSEPEHMTAAAIGVSPRTVRRIRQAIREEAGRLAGLS